MDPTERINAIAGARIWEERRRRGFSRAKLARLAGISEATIKRHELGERGIPIGVLIALCRALDIDAGDLLDAVQEQLQQEASDDPSIAGE